MGEVAERPVAEEVVSLVLSFLYEEPVFPIPLHVAVLIGLGFGEDKVNLAVVVKEFD